jgi:hypothetical protein
MQLWKTQRAAEHHSKHPELVPENGEHGAGCRERVDHEYSDAGQTGRSFMTTMERAC